MTTTTKLNTFEEDNEDKPKVQLYDGRTTPNMNGTSRQRSPRPVHRVNKDTMFKIFLVLLILALLIPILVLVSLIYGQTSAMQSDDSSSVRMASGLTASQDASNKIEGEQILPDAKNGKEYKQQMEEINKREPWRQNQSTTLTAWKQLGTMLSDSIDLSGDPCNDFYAYCCDQWKDRNSLDGRQEISDRVLVYENIKALILQTLDGIQKENKSWPESVRWAKNFYDQCTSINSAEFSARRQSVNEFLNKVFLVQVPSHKRRVRSAEHETAPNKTEIRINIITSTPPPDNEEIRLINKTAAVQDSLVALANETQFSNLNPFWDPSVTSSPNATSAPIGSPSPNVTSTPNGSPTPNGRPSPSETPNQNGTTQESASTENSDDIWEIAGLISETGVSTFFDVDYSKNSQDSNNIKTILHPPTLSLRSRKFYLEPLLWTKNMPVLEKSIIEAAKILHDPAYKNSVLFKSDQTTAHEIAQFENALAKASPTSNRVDGGGDFDFDRLKNQFPTAKSYSLSNLKSRWPLIEWDRFFPQGITNKSIKLDFFIVDPAYIDQLVGLLSDYDRSIVINYLKWRYVSSVIGYLKPADNADLNETCYQTLLDTMPLVVAHILYKTNYGLSKDDRDRSIYTPESIQFIFNATVRSLKSIIEFSPQIDNSSKKSIMDELSIRNLTLDWLGAVKDGTILDQIYADDMETGENSSFIARLNQLRSSDLSDDLINAWSDATPDIFFISRYVIGNTIAIVYDPRLINSQLSQAAVGQYATISWQIARELIKSIRYSPPSPLRNSKIDQCLINEYNRFCYQTSVNSCVDGVWTLEENFADTIALQTAFKAYKSWESRVAASGVADAFPTYLTASNLGRFTLEQIFLLTYGASFCYNANTQDTIDSLAIQRSTPDDYRLRGTVENLDEFHLAFFCKAGQKMYTNAKERCQL